jgi:ABC-type spermidine/putrescine transport system permease subunit II
MARRLALPLAVSLGAAFAAQLEGTMFTLWAADRTNGCSGSSPSEACSLNSVVAMIAGTFFAVETLAATLVALVLYRNGKRGSAALTAAALVAGLVLEHVWLVT